MIRPKLIVQAVALALMLPGAALAEFEISGEAKIEYSVYTSDGTVTGADEEHEAGDALKTEPSLKLFINSDVGEESSFHAELLIADDG
ncbi:MAG: RNA polymerase-associated protein rapA, partial [Gammaproteobacteria bacterium]|nr:RNA polymerase-associated protein rapA [Gammaproteobacteria bacterium]